MIIERNINDLSIIYCRFLINSNTRGISIRVKSREAPFANFIFNISPIFSESWKLYVMRIKVPRSEFNIRAISFKTVDRGIKYSRDVTNLQYSTLNI